MCMCINHSRRGSKSTLSTVIMSHQSETERGRSMSEYLPQTLVERGTEILDDALKSPIFALASVNDHVPSFARDGTFESILTRSKDQHRVILIHFSTHTTHRHPAWCGARIRNVWGRTRSHGD